MRKLKVSGGLIQVAHTCDSTQPMLASRVHTPPELSDIVIYIALPQSNQSIGGAVGSRWYPTAAGLADLGARGGPTLGSEQARLGAMTVKLL